MTTAVTYDHKHKCLNGSLTGRTYPFNKTIAVTSLWASHAQDFVLTYDTSWLGIQAGLESVNASLELWSSCGTGFYKTDLIFKVQCSFSSRVHKKGTFFLQNCLGVWKEQLRKCEIVHPFLIYMLHPDTMNLLSALFSSYKLMGVLFLFNQYFVRGSSTLKWMLLCH